MSDKVKKAIKQLKHMHEQANKLQTMLIDFKLDNPDCVYILGARIDSDCQIVTNTILESIDILSA
jgi:hypothetical protein